MFKKLSALAFSIILGITFLSGAVFAEDSVNTQDNTAANQESQTTETTSNDTGNSSTASAKPGPERRTTAPEITMWIYYDNAPDHASVYYTTDLKPHDPYQYVAAMITNGVDIDNFDVAFSSDIDGLISNSPSIVGNNVYSYTDFSMVRYLVKDNGSFTVTVTLTGKSGTAYAGETYTQTLTVSVVKSTPDAPTMDSDGIIDARKIDGTDECDLEFSEDGTNWHAPTDENGTFYSDNDYDWYFMVKAGYQGYVRYAETDYQNVSASTQISYFGTMDASSEKDITLKKIWNDGASGEKAEIVMEYDISPNLPMLAMPGRRSATVY